MSEALQEARRQVQICNACRYCEGFCDTFPALMRHTTFADGDLTHLANLCHNCRGCYYACQYTEPHEFALNLPKALADLRTESWQDYIWPLRFSALFQKNGVAVSLILILSVALLFSLASALGGRDNSFYDVLSHGMMVAIFMPAFLLPLGVIALGLRSYVRDTLGHALSFTDIKKGLAKAAVMKNLSGGHGQGCNFEDEDRFTKARKIAHQFVFWGFLACFASTSSGTVMHYVFDLHAPYAFWSLPKLFGVPGGIALSFGTLWLLDLKRRADQNLGAAAYKSGEYAFILVLFLVSTTGLALYWAGGTSAMPALLAIHLGCVFSFFVLMPYTKMVHAFFRLTALCVDAAKDRADGKT